MSAKLAALKPGRAQIMTAVSAALLSLQESRLAQIKSVLVALGNASLSAGSNKPTNNNSTTRHSDKPCYRWEKGTCNAGDSCRFSHAGVGARGHQRPWVQRRQRTDHDFQLQPTDRVCTYHPACIAHSTENCRSNRNAQSRQVNVTTHYALGGYEFSNGHCG